MIPFTVFSFHRIVYLILVWSDLDSAKFFVCDGVLLCSTVWPGTPRDPAASASQELGLKACAGTPRRVVVSVVSLELPIWLISFAVQTARPPLCLVHSLLLSPDA